jgi:hypothetical protein
VNNLKRFTICLTGHKWAKVSYPRSPEDEKTGMFLRCLRCGVEDHETGTHAPGAKGGFTGSW